MCIVLEFYFYLLRGGRVKRQLHLYFKELCGADKLSQDEAVDSRQQVSSVLYTETAGTPGISPHLSTNMRP